MTFNLFLRSLCGLLYALLLGNCTSAKINSDELNKIKTMKPPSDQALVYIVRPEAFGAAITFDVTCDDMRIGATRGKNFLYILLPPGPHSFMTNAENKSYFLLATEPGETYFLRQDVKTGKNYARCIWKILENETEGRNALSKCKLAADCVAYASKKQ